MEPLSNSIDGTRKENIIFFCCMAMPAMPIAYLPLSIISFKKTIASQPSIYEDMGKVVVVEETLISGFGIQKIPLLL